MGMGSSKDPCLPVERKYSLMLGELKDKDNDMRRAALNEATARDKYVRALTLCHNLLDELMADAEQEFPGDWSDLKDDTGEMLRAFRELWNEATGQLKEAGDPDVPDPIGPLFAIVVDMKDLVGDLLEIIWNGGGLSVAFTYAQAVHADWKIFQKALDKAKDAFDKQLKRVSMVRQTLIDCRRSHGQCAVCQRYFWNDELHTCEGCGAFFCANHYIQPVEEYEVEHGVSFAPR